MQTPREKLMKIYGYFYLANMAGLLSTPVTSQWDYTNLGDSPQNNSASGAELSSETELFWDFLQVLQ